MPLGSTTYQKGRTETINKVTSVFAFYQIPERKERGKIMEKYKKSIFELVESIKSEKFLRFIYELLASFKEKGWY